ncbi:MAG TPA: hypothetical protein VFM48_10785 [Aquabacterium sp.]|nr:hypothetical protein [Aquabacterium sp.]
MKKIVAVLGALALLPSLAGAEQLFKPSEKLPLPSQPQPTSTQASEQLSNCFADNTTGKDRKELARWIFLSISIHPSIRDLSAADNQIRIEADKSMARIVSALFSERCTATMRDTLSTEGSEGVSKAFRSLGELAMRELMTNPEVNASMGNYVQYLDKEKIEKALRK